MRQIRPGPDGSETGYRLTAGAMTSTWRRHGAHTCTDVTGFGRLGHLLEMLNAPRVNATLEVASVLELPDAREPIASGVVSTLHAENARCQDALVAKSVDAGAELLFDPQTAGGLLAGIPAARAQSCIAALRQSGYPHASIIDSVQDAASGRVEVELLCTVAEPRHGASLRSQ